MFTIFDSANILYIFRGSLCEIENITELFLVYF